MFACLVNRLPPGNGGSRQFRLVSSGCASPQPTQPSPPPTPPSPPPRWGVLVRGCLSEVVAYEAVDFGTALLEGGNAVAQGALLQWLQNPDVQLLKSFCERLRKSIQVPRGVEGLLVNLLFW